MEKTKWNVNVLLPGSWRGATTVLLSNGRRHTIVDTGMPHEAHRVLGALKRRGLHPDDIDFVLCTHFHVDHVSNNALFPKAVIIGSQESHDWCCSLYSDLKDEQNWEKLVLKYYPETFNYDRARDLMVRLRQFALRWWDHSRLGSSSQYRWIERDHLPDGMEPVVTGGHVPGHLSLRVLSNGTTAVIAGDALLTRAADQPVLTMIAHNREQMAADRDFILSLGGLVVPGHDHSFLNSLPDSFPTHGSL
jgi:glyoxylase-like metal-dependent hydrolase (beta-lactamase superfamily II)